MKRLSFMVSPELFERVEKARGDVARERWLRRAVEQALDGRGYEETSSFAHHVVDEPPAPAEQLVREIERNRASREFRPYPKGGR